MSKPKPGKTARKRIAEELTEAAEMIDPGETQAMECGFCYREFEITLEPKCRDGAPTDDIAPALVAFCPFCGAGDALVTI